jgi:hypothetical protein
LKEVGNVWSYSSYTLKPFIKAILLCSCEEAWRHRKSSLLREPSIVKSSELKVPQGPWKPPPVSFQRIPRQKAASSPLLGVLLLTVAVFDCYFSAQNKKKAARLEEDSAWYETNKGKTFDELGTGHPDFRYTM